MLSATKIDNAVQSLYESVDGITSLRTLDRRHQRRANTK
jgi:hypothetical protein